MNIINWNIRGVKSNGASERLDRLVRMHNVSLVILQEPFLPADQLEDYKNIIGFDYAASNKNSKIWFLWKNNLECTIINNSKQEITLKISHNGQTCWITGVYAKSTIVRRRKLWNRIRRIKNYVNGPWAIMGDFNSILGAAEKKGGVPYNLNKSTDFRTCMDDTGMTDLGFTGYPFTWCNGRGRSKESAKGLTELWQMKNG
ncbi:uncharacterized protein LOC132601317 [Lycium barbarum]|uniref:uncharacterized protein LOC132601317 n=1 Tax=Lycium barbarum TaxID=112863 RepID=UPI00293E12A3|nr:uncharacterized protein LOC132601317 [Lycium barbarum]